MTSIVMNNEKDSQTSANQSAGSSPNPNQVSYGKSDSRSTEDEQERALSITCLKSENVQLKQQLIRIKQERDILRKAFRIFSSGTVSLGDS